jgi:hypothetical protein
MSESVFTTFPYYCPRLPLIEQFSDLLICRVHDAPTKEGARTIETDSFINISQLAVALSIDLGQHCEHVFVGPTQLALYNYLYYVQWIKDRTNESSNACSRDEFLTMLLKWGLLKVIVSEY